MTHGRFMAWPHSYAASAPPARRAGSGRYPRYLESASSEGESMKLAIAGKGGSGKTSISGTLARLIARDGHTVLAIDGDTNPNLALTLGISADRINDLPVLPSGLLERGDDGPELKKSL